MQKRTVTVSHAPSSTTDTVVYAVHEQANYAEIKGIQVANTSTTDYEVDIRWMDDSLKSVSRAHYHGDGTTVSYYYYDYYAASAPATFEIIQDGYVPAGSVLSVIDGGLFLNARDLILCKPENTNSVNKLMATVIVCEYFDESINMATITSSDYRSIDRWFKVQRY